MKKSLGLAFILLTALTQSGCFIQSFQPFYTQDTLVESTATLGEWYLVMEGEEVIAEDYPEPWVFGKEQITTFHDSVSSELDVKYFRVNGFDFIDFSPSESVSGVNAWWQLHTVPVHSVCKLKFSADSLSLTPLDGGWVEKMLDEKKISLPYISVDDDEDHIVLTASAQELVSFLNEYGDNEEAFPSETEHLFKRTAYKK